MGSKTVVVLVTTGPACIMGAAMGAAMGIMGAAMGAAMGIMGAGVPYAVVVWTTPGAP